MKEMVKSPFPPSIRKKTRKKVVTLYVEGVTEEVYFNHLNKLGIFENISFQPKKLGSGGKHKFKNVHKRIQTLLQTNPESKFFILVDMDNGDSKPLAKEIIANLGSINEELNSQPQNYLMYNNYSFELFILNHKKMYMKKVVNKADYKKDLENLYDCDDYKGSQKDFEHICSKIKKSDVTLACENVEKLSNSIDENPNSTMDILFKNIGNYNK